MKKKKRKVIQIQMMQNPADPGKGYMVALCDDGTMWERIGQSVWRQIKAIPE